MRTIIILTYVFCLTAPVFGQLRYSDDFDNGRLDSVLVAEDTISLWPVEPLHVRVTGSTQYHRHVYVTDRSTCPSHDV